jgi:hypothetical protein
MIPLTTTIRTYCIGDFEDNLVFLFLGQWLFFCANNHVLSFLELVIPVPAPLLLLSGIPLPSLHSLLLLILPYLSPFSSHFFVHHKPLCLGYPAWCSPPHIL